jgi:ribonuclease VapC
VRRPPGSLGRLARDSRFLNHPRALGLETGVGTPTLAETGIVVEAKIGRTGRTLLARLILEGGVIAVPFGDDDWRAAVDAFARFGRGRHAAALSFGDCLTYATARLADEPLLCVGDEFAKTDLVLA